jgi:hypothetical protein
MVIEKIFSDFQKINKKLLECEFDGWCLPTIDIPYAYSSDEMKQFVSELCPKEYYSEINSEEIRSITLIPHDFEFQVLIHFNKEQWILEIKINVESNVCSATMYEDDENGVSKEIFVVLYPEKYHIL